MTEEGKEKQKLVDKAFSEIESRALMGISGEELERFMTVYEKIYSNLQGKNREWMYLRRKKEKNYNEQDR